MALDVLENLQNHLIHYEKTLEKHKIELPYYTSIEERCVHESLETTENNV